MCHLGAIQHNGVKHRVCNVSVNVHLTLLGSVFHLNFDSIVTVFLLTRVVYLYSVRCLNHFTSFQEEASSRYKGSLSIDVVEEVLQVFTLIYIECFMVRCGLLKECAHQLNKLEIH